MRKELFQLGRVVTTPSIRRVFEDKEITELLIKHQTGDRGCLCKEDVALNENAIKKKDDRIFSAYLTKAGKAYVITEWNYSYTTVLFADEY